MDDDDENNHHSVRAQADSRWKRQGYASMSWTHATSHGKMLCETIPDAVHIMDVLRMAYVVWCVCYVLVQEHHVGLSLVLSPSVVCGCTAAVLLDACHLYMSHE